MSKKILIIASLCLIATAGIIFFTQSKDGNLSDNDIKKMFKCNRKTKEYLSTDKYCQNPDLYRQEQNK